MIQQPIWNNSIYSQIFCVICPMFDFMAFNSLKNNPPESIIWSNLLPNSRNIAVMFESANAVVRITGICVYSYSPNTCLIALGYRSNVILIAVDFPVPGTPIIEHPSVVELSYPDAKTLVLSGPRPCSETAYFLFV